MMIALQPLDRQGLAWAQAQVKANHYLHTPVDPRGSVEGYMLWLDCIPYPTGCLLFGRPEATRCGDWYGGVDDVQAGRCEVTRWQVLNLARVWLHPSVQAGGSYCHPKWLPGYVDRNGLWRSTLASTIIGMALERVGFDYLVRRPPCFLDEPYQIRWLLSYCDTRLHRGTIYAVSGFERYRINERGIETWRIRLPALKSEQNHQVRRVAEQSERSRLMRARRAEPAVQMALV